MSRWVSFDFIMLSCESAAGGTNVVLDQEPFKTEPRRELHRDGWTETLNRLVRFLS